MLNLMTDKRKTRWKPLPAGVQVLAAASAGAVLLQTSRFDADNWHSFLFLDPVEVVTAREPEEVHAAFLRIESSVAAGLHAAGFVSYECGYCFEPSLNQLAAAQDFPLLWFGLFRAPYVFDHATGEFERPLPVALPEVAMDEAAVAPEALSLEISHEAYCARVREIKDYIAAGDTYQVNFTDVVRFPAASAAKVFAALMEKQPVAYSALVNTAERQILSLSPELFFKVEGERIVTRPMKGTMPRGLDAAADASAGERLRSDEKNRSEHVMIVDLLRNDLGRICATGSVTVEDLFSIERYETLLQMTSTISGVLRAGIGFNEIFRNLFPSGSVTGAPKIRTMELIRELEEMPRDIYTGAIGYVSPGGKAVFNVAIRTLVLEDGSARMGVGGAIVADSEPEEEYRECLLKAGFLTGRRRAFELIETMLWDGEFCRLAMHLDRLQASANYFSFYCDRAEIEDRLMRESAAFTAAGKYRIRLLLQRDGGLQVEAKPFVAEAAQGGVKIALERTFSGDVFLRHKTTERKLYDRYYREARAEGLDEVIFLNEKDEVTEGAISSIFIEKDGRLFTPPVSCGVLPGIFRQRLLEMNPAAEEKILLVDELECADAIYLTNSLRGMRKVELKYRGNALNSVLR
jgi:para-aminobenzoate synthetase/4-amino-4-deoxychorismate lyase